MNQTPAAPRPWLRPLLLLGAVLLLLLLAKTLGLGQRLAGLRVWIGGLGSWGAVVFFLLYVAAVVAAVPGTAVTVAAGALFGSVLGVILVSLASTTGAGICFLVARFLAREAVTRWLAGNRHFQRLDRLTEEHGALIVAITRLVPLFPFNLLNYGFGLTQVRFGTYLFWSWLCMLPGTVLYVVGADALFRGLAEGRIPWALVAAVVAAAGVLALLARSAKKRLDRDRDAAAVKRPGG